MEIQKLNLPDHPPIITVEIPLPTVNIPSYTPMVVPPSDLRPPDGIEAESNETTDTGVRTVDIPILILNYPYQKTPYLLQREALLWYQ